MLFTKRTPLHLVVILFYISLGLQLLFFAVYAFAFLKKRTLAAASPLPVSVIVCAHDEEENLKELIPALLRQDHSEFEVIIVDDRSNDNTFDLLLAETAKDHRLRMVHVNRTPAHADSKKWALTLGIKAARYEWILLTDADCRPAGNRWISTMSSAFGNGIDFVLGYSPYIPTTGLLNAFIRFETLLTGMQYLSFAIFGLPYMGVGRNLAYRRSRFLAVKGFNAVLGVTGGDDDLLVNKHARRNNTTVCTSVDAQTLSIPETRWRSFFYQKVRHLAVGRKYRLHHRLLLGVFAISWIGVWFLGIPLAVSADHTDVWIGLLLRIIAIMLTVNLVAKKLGQPFPAWMVPVLDFIYAFYYLVTGLQALVTQKIRWKS